MLHRPPSAGLIPKTTSPTPGVRSAPPTRDTRSRTWARTLYWPRPPSIAHRTSRSTGTRALTIAMGPGQLPPPRCGPGPPAPESWRGLGRSGRPVPPGLKRAQRHRYVSAKGAKRQGNRGQEKKSSSDGCTKRHRPQGASRDLQRSWRSLHILFA